MIEEALILAGGKGTRLQSIVSKLPKSMAPINGIPFLSYQFNLLLKHEIKTAYLAVGHLSELIKNYYGNSYQGINLEYIKENEPLGTGGAISQAISHTKTNDILVLNGDSIFTIDLKEFFDSHVQKQADFSVALKKLKNFDRYGVVKMDDNQKIIDFEEKQHQQEGHINGGVYILNKLKFGSLKFPKAYSFEKEFLESQFNNFKFYGYPSTSYFLDIGIPEDYEQAQQDFKSYKDWEIDATWTLFLDRDGVINKQIKGGYVTSEALFEFIPGVLDSIKTLSKIFGRIVIVTNQQCIGKGIISRQELESIHLAMCKDIEKANGKIDKVYYAPNLASENSELRKPNSGMAELAKNDFPEINFTKSVMVGDSISDIEFGNRKNMKTVLISNELNRLADRCFSSLEKFTKSIS